MARASWDKKIDRTKFNVLVAWSPAVVERSLPIRELLASIFQDGNAHVYLAQGPPTKMITRSAFDKLPPEQQEKQTFNWVPDHHYAAWRNRITIVEEKHGPFVDSTTLACLGIPYIGCGTALLHIQGSVKDGKAAVILPTRNDGLSNLYWRMGERDDAALQGDGQQVPGHGKHIRLFECEPTKEHMARIVALVKQWK